jgi:CDP-glucose 4,6-dehydratase
VRYLITGHTGFKGSWLSLMLQMQGHEVSGISLDPPKKSLFEEANLTDIFKHDLRVDIRNRLALKAAIEAIDPEIVIHLAAQSLVRESYKTPVETFETNVIGTLNLLEATKELKSLKATLVITTDKVYKNKNLLAGYKESDELGGDDPYSASKAAADIATQSWIKSFGTTPVAIARAGNVIGGGDWATDRLIPDLVTAYTNGSIPVLRYPNAIRPWQHVLDCLNGYLMLVAHMITTKEGGEWNFGPNLNEKYSVSDLVTRFAENFNVQGMTWNQEQSDQPHEASYLLLGSDKARHELGWKDVLSFTDAVSWSANWYQDSASQLERTIKQIQEFEKLESQ